MMRSSDPVPEAAAALARIAASSMPVGERHRGRAAGGLSRPGPGDTLQSVSQTGKIGIQVGAAVCDKKQQNSPADQDRERVPQGERHRNMLFAHQVKTIS